MNPKLVWQAVPPGIPGLTGNPLDPGNGGTFPTAVDKVGQMMEGVRQNAGELGEAARQSEMMYA